MIRERMFAIACGYADCDDLDALRHDPAFRIACERLPDSGPALASLPTLSRLENTPSWRDLARMGLKQIDLFCASSRVAPGYIVLDIDDTPDRTHGDQQLSLFNTHAHGYGSHFLACSNRRALAGASSAFRQMEQRLCPLQSSVSRSFFEALFRVMNENPDFEYILLDRTIIRARQHSTGAQKGG